MASGQAYPALRVMQERWVPSVVVPLGHSRQVEAAPPLTYPTPHNTGGSKGVAHMYPAGHERHAALAELLAYVPLPHMVQLPAPSELKEPASQGMAWMRSTH